MKIKCESCNTLKEDNDPIQGKLNFVWDFKEDRYICIDCYIERNKKKENESQ